MLFLLGILFGLLLGLLGGGNLSNLARLRFRWPWLLVGAVLVREAVTFSPVGHVDGAQYVYVLSLTVIVAWTIWHLRILPGVWLITIGALSNLIVVAANEGRMPVSVDLARNQLGGILVERGTMGQYTLMGPNTRLAWLGDWLSVWPLPQAYSPGDLVIAMGLALVVLVSLHRIPDSNVVT